MAEPGGRVELLRLRGACKADPEGHVEDFRRQLRHFRAGLAAARADPARAGAWLGELAGFLAHCAACYPGEAADVPGDIQGLLERHGRALRPPLRLALVQALVLLRNRGQLGALELMSVLFRLFGCPDKALRKLAFSHVVQDLRRCNQGRRDEPLNRQAQAFLYRQVQQTQQEVCAQKALAVLSEMWRRNVWRDARTVNVIAEAAFHPKTKICVGSLKFLMGQDVEAGDSDDEESDDEGGGGGGGSKGGGSPAVTREDRYRATNKGTDSSKKKKARKLKRVERAMKKAERAEKDGGRSESFAALQLLHDPQGFAERLFVRLEKAREGFDTRLLMMGAISRVVGVHKALLINFYPFLQRYLQPRQRMVTHVLAAAIQATHEQVPEDILWPLVHQVAMEFVSERSQAEVMQVGMKTIREICVRQPLVMREELLRDLAQYKKDRDKGVSMAARSLIGLFRELHPELLVKKDRGKGADLDARPDRFGEARPAGGIDGLELLVEAKQKDLEGSGSEEDDDEEEGGEGDEPTLVPIDWDLPRADGEESLSGGSSGEEEGDGDEAGGEEEEGADDGGGRTGAREPEKGSLSALKRRLKQEAAEREAAEREAAGAEDPGALAGTEFLSQEDFARMKSLKKDRLMGKLMERHGLGERDSAAKKGRAKAAAEQDVERARKLREGRGRLSERKINPDDLLGSSRKAHDKETRLRMVREGREGREAYTAATKRRKLKDAGLSNKEKESRKILPKAAYLMKARRRVADKGRSRSHGSAASYGKKRKR